MRTMQIYTNEGCGFSASLRELLDDLLVDGRCARSPSTATRSARCVIRWRTCSTSREIPYEKVMVEEGTDAYDALVQGTA